MAYTIRFLHRGSRILKAIAILLFFCAVLSLMRHDRRAENPLEPVAHVRRFQPGDRLPEIKVPLLCPDSAETIIPPERGELLLMIYSARCPLCHGARSVWNRLAEELERVREIPMLALSALDEDATLMDLESQECRSPVGLLAPATSGRRIGVIELPAILYIKDSIVVRAWYRVIGDVQAMEIMQQVARVESTGLR